MVFFINYTVLHNCQLFRPLVSIIAVNQSHLRRLTGTNDRHSIPTGLEVLIHEVWVEASAFLFSKVPPVTQSQCWAIDLGKKNLLVSKFNTPFQVCFWHLRNSSTFCQPRVMETLSVMQLE